MSDGARSGDTNRVGIGIPANFLQRSLGVFDVWTTRNGIPVAGLERADGSKAYRTQAFNSCTTAMLNLIRDIMSRLGTNASGPAGGLWTAGPYIGLVLNAQTINAATTLATAGTFEASGNGYTGRIAPTWAAGSTGVWSNNASAASWTASGGNLGGAALGQLFTTPAASGTGTAPNTVLMTFATLNGGPYTVATGNTLNVTYQMTHS
jgi:hypothetical protein